MNIETKIVKPEEEKHLMAKDIKCSECFAFTAGSTEGRPAMRHDEGRYSYLDSGMLFHIDGVTATSSSVIRLHPRNPFEFDIVED